MPEAKTVVTEALLVIVGVVGIVLAAAIGSTLVQSFPNATTVLGNPFQSNANYINLAVMMLILIPVVGGASLLIKKLLESAKLE